MKHIDDELHIISPWQMQRGLLDVQITGDTHTVQREVEQELTFSTPYYYDGASYNGNATFVQCAYEQKRYGECENLVICVLGEMPKNYIARHFSPEFYLEAGNWEEVFDNYKNGTCNVFSGDRLAATAQLGAANLTGNHVIDNLTFTNEPLALVTRNDESEWSDIVNWVLQALFYGEREGLVRDESLCDKNMPTNNVAKLNFLNAVYCIGNYKEIYAREFGSNPRNDINHINYGTRKQNCFLHDYCFKCRTLTLFVCA
jgi:general L-amino acid transport system substrate-binding protein